MERKQFIQKKLKYP